MNCPKCGNAFEDRPVRGALVKECPQCHGLWFEHEELRMAIDEADAELRWMDFDMWKDQELFHVSTSALQCPKCQKRMAAVRYDDSTVVVDSCAECQGTWLDKGEFHQLIGVLQTEARNMSASDYAHETLKEAAELVVGDKGFISEWRDLRTVMRLMSYRLVVENPNLQERLLALYRSSPIK